MRYVTARQDDAGRPLAIDDPLASRIAEMVGAAADPGAIVERLLSITEMFGELADDVALRGLLTEALIDITRAGAPRRRCVTPPAVEPFYLRDRGWDRAYFCEKSTQLQVMHRFRRDDVR